MLSMCYRERERKHCVSSQDMRRHVRPRRSAAFFALLLALLFSTSLAGRKRSFSTDQDSLRQQGEGLVLGGEQSEALAAKQVHARMLKAVTTSDYGSYDPSPSMNKPHFKLIPN